MKLAILAAFLGSAAVASASKTVAGDVDVDFESHSIVKYVYAPPAVDTDLATLWNELAVSRLSPPARPACSLSLLMNLCAHGNCLFLFLSTL